MEEFHNMEAKVSTIQLRNIIFKFGFISCSFYIIFLLLMKMFGLMHVTELRAVNYLILGAVGFYEIGQVVKKEHAYVSFLTVLSVVFFTGLFSFFLFSIFTFVYSKFDSEMAELLLKSTQNFITSMPSIVIMFEGSAASIIVAFICMQYFRKFEEGEEETK